MKALKDCDWQAEIKKEGKQYWWELSTEYLTGLYTYKTISPAWKFYGFVYKTKQSAVRNLKKFIKINGLTCDLKKL